MSDRCNKCRVSRRSEGNAWCLGCLSWETLERELTGSWVGPGGLRVIADNLVLGAAREVRALRALGAGLGQAPSGGAGSLPSGHRAPRPVKEETPEPLEGATAKKKPDGDPGARSTRRIEKDQLAQPVVAPEVDRRPELPRRSRVPDQAGGRKDRTDPPSRSYPEKPRSRSRRRREDAKDKRKERDPDKRRDRRDPGEVDPKRSDRSAHRSGGKKKKKRGGRKHKRLGRLEADPYRAIHRSLDKGGVEEFSS